MAKLFLRITSFICSLTMIAPFALWSDNVLATGEAAAPSANAATCQQMTISCKKGEAELAANCEKMALRLDALQAQKTNADTEFVRYGGEKTVIQEAVAGNQSTEVVDAGKNSLGTLGSVNAIGTACGTGSTELAAEVESWSTKNKTQLSNLATQRSKSSDLEGATAAKNCASAMSKAASKLKSEASKNAKACHQAAGDAKREGMNIGSILKTAGLLAAGGAIGALLASLLGGKKGSDAPSGDDDDDDGGEITEPPGTLETCAANSTMQGGVCKVDSPDDAKCDSDEEMREDGKCYAKKEDEDKSANCKTGTQWDTAQQSCVITASTGNTNNCKTGTQWDTAQQSCVIITSNGNTNLGNPEDIELLDSNGDGIADADDSEDNGSGSSPDGGAPSSLASSATRNGSSGSGSGAKPNAGRGFASFQSPSGGGGAGGKYGGGGSGSGGAGGGEAGTDAQNTLNYMKWKNPDEAKSLEERMREKYN